jgi:LemA protein
MATKGENMSLMFIIPIIGIVVCFMLYNSVIGKKNEVENAMGGLDAQLKQRYDLIPNLVSSVKTYMQHEAGTLEKIVQLRSQVSKKNISMEEKQEMNKEISKALSGIMVQVEQYPDLKSSANFQELQKTLYEVEQNIAASRRFYNAAVTDFNNALEMFPTNIIGGIMRLKRKEIFNIPETERKNVNIQNLFDGKVS